MPATPTAATRMMVVVLLALASSCVVGSEVDEGRLLGANTGFPEGPGVGHFVGADDGERVSTTVVTEEVSTLETLETAVVREVEKDDELTVVERA